MSRNFNKYFFETIRYTGREPSYDDWVAQQQAKVDEKRDEMKYKGWVDEDA